MPKIVKFGRFIHFVTSKNIKWRQLIWATMYVHVAGNSNLLKTYVVSLIKSN